MAITGAFILETILKWFIPFLCLAIVGFLTMRFINPFKKGNEQQKLEEWKALEKQSDITQSLAGKEILKVKEETAKVDQQILDKLERLHQDMQENREMASREREKTNKSLDILREGVLDGHFQNLVSSCQTFIEHGYITHAELIQYNERLAIYHKLGGNGHMEPWDERIKALPIHN